MFGNGRVLRADEKRLQHNRDRGFFPERGGVVESAGVNATGEIPHASCSAHLPRRLHDTDKLIGTAAKKTRRLLSPAVVPVPEDH